MANTTVGVDVNIKTNVKGSIGELKALKKQLKETAAGSEDFKRLTNEIDDLEDKLKGSKQAAGDWIDQLSAAPGPLGVVGNSLNKLKVSTQSFGGALKATGIGLFVAALGGLIAAFAQSERATKKLQPLLEGFQRIFNGIFAAIEPVFDAFIDLATQALPFVTKGFSVAYSAITSFLQGLGSLGQAVSKLIKGDFTGAWDSAKEAVTGFGKRYDEANKRFIEGTKEVTKAEQEELDKRKEAQEKAAEERKARLLQIQQAELELLKRRKKTSDEIFLSEIEDEKMREEIRLATQFENDKAEIENTLASEQAKEEALKILKQKFDLDRKVLADQRSAAEIDAITNKLFAEVQAEQEASDLKIQNSFDELDAITNNLLAEVDAESKASEAKKQIAQAEADLKKQQLSEVGGAIENLTTIVGKDTIAGKALGIATALINTYQGASEAIKQKSTLPSPFDVIAKVANVGAIIATGLKTVKAITSVQVPAVKGGGSAAASIPTPPSISTTAPISPSQQLQASSTLLNAQAIQELGSATNRSYVLESDVTNSQERIKRINRAARLA